MPLREETGSTFDAAAASFEIAMLYASNLRVTSKYRLYAHKPKTKYAHITHIIYVVVVSYMEITSFLYILFVVLLSNCFYESEVTKIGYIYYVIRHK